MKINGKKVVDARKSIMLTISKSDVTNGQIKKPDSCAIALACKRHFGAISAKVHLSRTYVELDNKWVRFHTPDALRTEIISFDRGKKFEEGEYKIPAIRPSARLTGKATGSEINKTNPNRNRNTNAKGKHHFVIGVRASAYKNLLSRKAK